MFVISDVLVGLTVILLFYAFRIYYNGQRIRVLVDQFAGPKALPFVGNALDFYFNRKAIAKFIYGQDSDSIVRLWVSSRPVIYLSDPNDVQAILSSPTQIAKSAEYDFYVPWLGYGVFTSSGMQWKKTRKLLAKILNMRVFKGFLRVFNDQSHVLIHQLNAQIVKNDTFDVVPFTTFCAFDILCETIFGIKSNTQITNKSPLLDCYDGIKKAIHERTFKMLLWPHLLFNLSSIGREHNKCIKRAHAYTENIVKTKRLERENNNFENSEKNFTFIDFLMEVNENGEKFSDAAIRVEADALIFAGYDTLSSSFGWALFFVGSNPHVQEKIHKEVDKIFGEEKFKDLTAEDLKEMTYLECVIKESLRRIPTVPVVGRKLESDVVLNDGRVIPAGVSVCINIVKIHKDPTAFPQPKVFDPDRFLPENSEKRHPCAFIPFSNGPRNCIGHMYAMLEEKAVLSHIFRSFSIKTVHSLEEVKPKADLTILAKNGVKLQFTPRA